MKEISKLYTAYTLADNFMRRSGVRIDWFAANRTQPVAPYETLIENYAGMKGEEKFISEKNIDEFFDADEIEHLRKYIHSKYHADLITAEVDVPMRFSLKDGIMMPHVFLAYPGYHGMINLSRSPGYPLNVQVWGVFDTSIYPIQVDAVEEGGREFLTVLTRRLGIDLRETEEGRISLSLTPQAGYDGHISDLLLAIMDETGLYVTRHNWPDL